LFDPQQWNRYSYAANSPLNFNDPNGMQIKGKPAKGCSDGPNSSLTQEVIDETCNAQDSREADEQTAVIWNLISDVRAALAALLNNQPDEGSAAGGTPYPVALPPTQPAPPTFPPATFPPAPPIPAPPSIPNPQPLPPPEDVFKIRAKSIGGLLGGYALGAVAERLPCGNTRPRSISGC
jgi:hypothetical protein